MKVKGADLIRFWKEWPPGVDVYYEDCPYSENDGGVLCEVLDDFECGSPVDPEGAYILDCGFLGWQGKGDAPPDFEDDLVRVFRKWLRAQTHKALTALVPKEDVDVFKALCKERNWKVI